MPTGSPVLSARRAPAGIGFDLPIKFENYPAQDSRVHRSERRSEHSINWTLEPTDQRKIAIGLTALLLVAAVSKRGAAQEAIAFPQIPCIWYEAVEFPSCVNYGSLSEEQARAVRGHPQFIEPQAAASQDREHDATPDLAAHASRVVPSSPQ